MARFLDQLANALRLGMSSGPEIGRTALLHGHDLRLQGLSMSEVVHEYGGVCQSITELAVETDATITTDDFRTLNRCLDDAIAGALTEYSEHAQSSIDGAPARGYQRLVLLAHEARHGSHAALLALEALQTGRLGVTGSTGAQLHRTLIDIAALIERALAEVRLAQPVQRILVADFIDDLAPSVAFTGNDKGITLAVMPVEKGVAVEGNAPVLAAALGKLLQNAFKFTRPCTTVTLRVVASADRVLLEVQDECGGRPAGAAVRPFEQRSTDRTGLGLGLAFSRWAVEAHQGRVYGRNMPDEGCIFTIDLPRLRTAAVGRA